MARWFVLLALLLAAILVPFFLLEEIVTRHVEEALHSPPARNLVAPAIAVLLAADIFLPVPSSVVSTAAGSLLGVGVGAAVSFVGMTAGCLLGYVIAQRWGAQAAERFVGKEAMQRVRRASLRYGAGVLLLARAIPVLGEASVLFAGLTAVPLPRFVALVSAGNLTLSLTYAAMGHALLPANFFLPAFMVAVALPLVAFEVVKRARSGKRGEPSEQAVTPPSGAEKQQGGMMTKLHITQDDLGFWMLSVEDAEENLTLLAYQFDSPDHLLEHAQELVTEGRYPDAVTLMSSPRTPSVTTADTVSAADTGAATLSRPAPRKVVA